MQTPHDNIQDRRDEALTQEAEESLAEKQIMISRESEEVTAVTFPQTPKLNSVLQVTKGPHRGRLCQVGRIDRDTFHCFIVTRDNGRDFIDVKPDEYILVAHSKKGMTGLKEPLDAQSVTPQATEDSPFAGFKG